MLLNASPTASALTLSEWAAPGDWRLFFLHRDRVEKVTAGRRRAGGGEVPEVRRTARVGLVLPDEGAGPGRVPAPPDAGGDAEGLQGQRGDRRRRGVRPDSPENIEKRTTRTRAARRDSRWPSCPKKTRGGRWSPASIACATATRRACTGKADRGRALAGGMLDAGHDRSTRGSRLKDELDKLKARLSFSGGARRIDVSVETTRANLGRRFDLVGEMLREPAFPADEFEILQAGAAGRLEQQKTEPQAARGAPRFAAQLSALPEGRRPLHADGRGADRPTEGGDARPGAGSFYRDILRRARHGELIGGRRLRSERDRRLCDRALRRLEGPRAVQADRATATPSGGGRDETIETPDKANAVFVAGMT